VLACLVLTVVDNLRLRKQVAALNSAVTKDREVAIGPAPGAITAADPQSNVKLISETLTDETTIVLVASFNCVFSKDSMPVWRDLAAQLPNTRFVLLRVDGQSAAGDRSGVKYGESTFGFPDRPNMRWLVASGSTVAAYRLGFVPQTIVARKGQIVFVRTGALTPEHIARIRSAVL
jgi:hypothetical protein